MLDLRNQTAIVVGGTGGLGRAIAQLLAARGARVVVVGQTFRDTGTLGIEFVQADLSLMAEAGRVARALPAEAADFLIFTTGIFAAPQRKATAEGIEQDLAVSYLNRLVMLREMAPQLGKARSASAAKPRVFLWGYPGTGQIGNPDDLNAEHAYKPFAQHMNTVAGNEILVLDAARRYPHLNVYGVNPGLVKTNIRSNFLGHRKFVFSLLEGIIGLLTPSPAQYARRMAPLLVSPAIEPHSGALFDNKARAILPSEGLTEAHIRKFTAVSEALLARVGIAL
ncbi:MAG: SDR family NAD(P)-dependent oxidoreductase [Azonexus sp.]|uniref:SDR family NAD(P)-dependent oxidoreductase n=1 Tax=Azonexus sp. TaxID=1872668 RepID=UPI0028203BA3|nr:SDR family NAD(P)-dependent oxidoreductase [Azonexus sp.]MDR0776747.1 SDR family NAD(P)-dependent oxidoreductase [Azonexus sp.]